MKTKMSGLQIGSAILGDQCIANADYRKLKVLGSLQAEQCSFADLTVLGNTTLNNCTVEKSLVNGALSATGGSIRENKTNGMLTLHNVDCGVLSILGELRGSQIHCQILTYGGPTLFKRVYGKALRAPSIQGNTLENFFPLQLDGTQEFDTIINVKRLVSDVETACRRFFNFGSCELQELNADLCYLYPFHSPSIKELHGSLVIIDPAFDEAWLKEVPHTYGISQYCNSGLSGRARIKVIEADEVIIDHAEVDVIRSKRVSIGPNARVRLVEYSDQFTCHEQGCVKEVRAL